MAEKVEGVPRRAPVFLRPSSPGLTWLSLSTCSPSEPALSAGHCPPRHRAAAPHAYLPHRHLHPLQERQAHQVGGWLLGGQPRAWQWPLAQTAKVVGMGCWVGVEERDRPLGLETDSTCGNDPFTLSRCLTFRVRPC